MDKYVDFAAIKQRVHIETAITFLALKRVKQSGDQHRYTCPVCKGDDELSINVASEKFQCFKCRKSGTDSIALVAHVRGIRQREAAELLDQNFPENRAPSRERVLDGRREPQEPSTALSVKHAALDALGLSAATCEALGAGYSADMERVILPLRLPTGVSIGFMGIATREDQAPLLLFPKDMDEKVQQSTPDALRKLFRIA